MRGYAASLRPDLHESDTPGRLGRGLARRLLNQTADLGPGDRQTTPANRAANRPENDSGRRLPNHPGNRPRDDPQCDSCSESNHIYLLDLHTFRPTDRRYTDLYNADDDGWYMMRSKDVFRDFRNRLTR